MEETQMNLSLDIDIPPWFEFSLWLGIPCCYCWILSPCNFVQFQQSKLTVWCSGMMTGKTVDNVWQNDTEYLKECESKLKWRCQLTSAYVIFSRVTHLVPFWSVRSCCVQPGVEEASTPFCVLELFDLQDLRAIPWKVVMVAKEYRKEWYTW